jgi:hypothetical protein
MANQFLIKDKMQDMKSLDATEIAALETGVYTGVQLLGYHEKGDTPAPIIYFLSETQAPNNNISVIDVNTIKLEHVFKDVIDIRYAGAQENADFSEQLQHIVTSGVKVNITRNVKVEGPIVCENLCLFSSNGCTIKPFLTSYTNIFEISGSVEISDIDFNLIDVSGMSNLFLIQDTAKSVKFDNVGFYDLKDLDNSKGTQLLNMRCKGTYFSITNCRFKNMFKLGNGNVTDAAGSLNLIYISSDNNEISTGLINNIIFQDVHNIDGAGNIIQEDTSCLYFASLGKYINANVENITGYNFGKRLIKVQSSGIIFENIKGYNEIKDCMSLIGNIGETGFFDVFDNSYSQIYFKGYCAFAIGEQGTNTSFDNVNLHVDYDSTLTSAGIFLSGNCESFQLSNFNITAFRPIMLSNQNDSKAMKGVQILDGIINLSENATIILSIPGNASLTKGEISNLIVRNLVVNLSNVHLSTVYLLVTFSANLKYNNFNFSDITLVNNSLSKVNFGDYNYIDGLKLERIKEINKLPILTKVDDLLYVRSSNNIFINNIEAQCSYNRGINIQSSSDVYIGRSNIIKETNLGQLVLSGNSNQIKVEGYYKILNVMNNPKQLLYHMGETAVRPINSPIGFEFFNTTAGVLEIWNGTTWQSCAPIPIADLTIKGLVNKAAASVNSAVEPSTIYSQSEIQSILSELRDLKSKLRTAGILAS